MEHSTGPERQLCRLCNSETTEILRKTVLAKHSVGFFRCGKCRSLQTEKPHWLAEAYADDRPLTDTGMVVRTQELAMKADLLFSALRVPSEVVCTDVGGSLGLFARMMRDRGYKFFRHDPYSRNFYVPFHDAGDAEMKQAAIITCFEVLEHLPEPGKQISEWLHSKPDVFLATTNLYDGQDSDWWYFAPDRGQHIFFYSATALQAIAEANEMHLFSDGSLHCFCRRYPTRLSYDETSLLNIKQLFESRQDFFVQSLQLAVSRWLTPYQYCGLDHQEATRRMDQMNTAELQLR